MLLAGCSALQLACPAVGWINVVTVQIEGSAEAVGLVERVEFCDDRQCSQSAAALPDTSSVLPYIAEKIEQGRWRISTDMSAPETATIRALAADGAELAATTETLDWERVGGSEQCGGPGVADVSIRV